ncbi:hypothetical protein MMYC01_207832 [Madurella mycetomatis]|uniref:Uncharacterized protein n=1 Tax=Madurella mycetomatis TaxID=100816 RepID=A0A175VUK4_9PEZI|nr:hypothetical protein MMYC01_207832 [Madurella mycetomatis]
MITVVHDACLAATNRYIHAHTANWSGHFDPSFGRGNAHGNTTERRNRHRYQRRHVPYPHSRVYLPWPNPHSLVEELGSRTPNTPSGSPQQRGHALEPPPRPTNPIPISFTSPSPSPSRNLAPSSELGNNGINRSHRGPEPYTSPNPDRGLNFEASSSPSDSDNGHDNNSIPAVLVTTSTATGSLPINARTVSALLWRRATIRRPEAEHPSEPEGSSQLD